MGETRRSFSPPEKTTLTRHQGSETRKDGNRVALRVCHALSFLELVVWNLGQDAGYIVGLRLFYSIFFIFNFIFAPSL